MRTFLLPLLLLAATPAFAGVRQDATVLMPENEDRRKVFEEWGFSEAVIAGDTVHLSGHVIALPRGSTDLQAAYTQAFDMIGAVLKRAGASWDDVVDITSYHTDMTTQMPAILPVKNRYVKAPFPAWTAIGVTRLVPGNGITEIKIVAKLPSKNS